MEQSLDVIVGVRFSHIGKVYYFEASHLPDLKLGESVVVETSRGWQLGQIAKLLDKSVETPDGGWKRVDRRATPRDLLLRQECQKKEVDVVIAGRSRTAELHLQGVKVVGAEFSLDGNRLSILFSSDKEDKVELKSLRPDMQRLFSPAQVELRQIGPRDVAKMLGGMGACGLETRCCSKFLTDFSSISIRMAKEQGISLTPAEITGMCGRLRCCLIYEYELYCTARQGLPKRNKRVRTAVGDGRVIDVIPLRESVMVEMADGGIREFTKEEISLIDENAEPAEKKDDQAEVQPPIGSSSQSNSPRPGQGNRPPQGDQNRRPNRDKRRPNL